MGIKAEALGGLEQSGLGVRWRSCLWLVAAAFPWAAEAARRTKNGLSPRRWVSVYVLIRDLWPRQPLMPWAAAVGGRVPPGGGCSGRWHRVWSLEFFFLGFVSESLLLSFTMVIGRSRRWIPGTGASARRGREVTPPRAPPPGGGCCYSQPESLGEGEEEAAAVAAVSAICRRRRREVGREEVGGQGRCAGPVPLLSLPAPCERRGRVSWMSSLGERKWPEPSRLLANPRVGKRPANSWLLKLPGKALPLPAG